MAKNYTKMLLVSANVGSIFEDPDRMLQLWLNEFLATIRRLEPEFLAIHCQEVGGKNYEESMQHVNSFVKALFSAETMQNYDRSRCFLDEDFTAVDQFTALGNIYFVHSSVPNVQIYDFHECQFVTLTGREVLSGNIANISIKEKAKFPQEYFPDFKWSRKGFIRTRWSIQNSIFDLVNIHLFHDASNIAAMESSPSQYSNNRNRTLRYTINRFETDKFDKVPQFMFGDFNFRLDSHQLIPKLTEGSIVHQTKGKKNDISKIVFTNKTTDEMILTLEKKGFDLPQSKEIFLNNNGHWLHQFDKEALPFRDKLLEYDITFPPTYPFSEDVEDETCYNKTRCPAWCDRILYTPNTRSLFYDENVDYGMIGTEICMGDHKPIYLSWKLRHNTGNDVSDVKSRGNRSSSGVFVRQTSVDIAPHRPMRKVISINGEEVCAQDLSEVNIHDYATFESQEHVGRKFMSSIKRKSDGGTRFSFKNVVKDVMQRERIMRALKHYSHRSDSETEDTDEEPVRNSTSSSEASKVFHSSSSVSEVANDCASRVPLASREESTISSAPQSPASIDETQSNKTDQNILMDVNKNEAVKGGASDQVTSCVIHAESSDNNSCVAVRTASNNNNDRKHEHNSNQQGHISATASNSDGTTITVVNQITHNNKSTNQDLDMGATGDCNKTNHTSSPSDSKKKKGRKCIVM